MFPIPHPHPHSHLCVHIKVADSLDFLQCLQEFTKSFDISKGFGHVTATPGKPAVVGSQSPSEVQGAIRRLEDYDSESGHEAEEEEKRGVQGNASLMECD